MILNEVREMIENRFGDESIEHLQAVVNRYCLSITGSIWDAEDLAQDTWLKAISTLNDFGQKNVFGHKNPEAYLLRIAKNTWIDQARRKNLFLKILKREQPEVALPENGSFEIETAFLALRKHLTPLQRTVFLLRDVFGYSIAEAADKLQTTEGAVKAALHRARLALDAVKDELEQSILPVPKEEGLKAFLRALAAAYQMGDIATLIELAQQDELEPAVVFGIAQNQVIGKSLIQAQGATGQNYGIPMAHTIMLLAS
ncbi:RNA polymerase sigma factor [Paenibacillus eucommiae]|uniref:RNA polymerase sigma-70 factor (ECF subfamily) n=1 Tax=Paenibacillus eucommiae TaxID=1355755 RepID=A0ABS4JB64_9BACL|nr:RNA polymerase sigma factor [Paenibacillus eucommiae]MBP1997085.1 RNA polymerase sigma-70 factor (ECF subfamily) [Paenibacillus eucommiae]